MFFVCQSFREGIQSGRGSGVWGLARFGMWIWKLMPLRALAGLDCYQRSETVPIKTPPIASCPAS